MLLLQSKCGQGDDNALAERIPLDYSIMAGHTKILDGGILVLDALPRTIIRDVFAKMDVTGQKSHPLLRFAL
jgi:hypothetical protein